MIDNFRRHRRVGALVFLVLLPACYNWQLTATTPVLPEDVPSGKVRITRTDGSRTVLHRVSVSSDTLGGLTLGPTLFRMRADSSALVPYRQQVPLADITRLETRQIAAAQTWLVIVLPLALMVFGVALAAADPWGNL